MLADCLGVKAFDTPKMLLKEKCESLCGLMMIGSMSVLQARILTPLEFASLYRRDAAFATYTDELVVKHIVTQQSADNLYAYGCALTYWRKMRGEAL